eukprot:TRINITY_DN9667_c0_g1_i2.p1 TRINITY_DN9667_c0_g1~~TRINITY_DN9667_c0_g1_i2.p1  ORF type:complete len:395 (-),score=72.70 TRINITY_DN9667_c0_g1_i2:82-1125(-)
MFGELAEKNDIKIVDCDLKAFLVFLQYAYTEEITFEPDTVLEVTNLAVKYQITEVIDKSSAYLLQTLTLENALTLFNHAQLWNVQDVLHKCWQIIQSQSEQAVACAEFRVISEDLLLRILRDDGFVCQEQALFKACLAWADAECERRHRSADVSNKRDILAKVLPLIRFPTMTLQFISTEVAASKILTDQELLELLLHLGSEGYGRTSFPTVPRIANETVISDTMVISGHQTWSGALVIANGGVLTCQPWDGKSGGLLSIKASKIHIQKGGQIDATGKGFRGGISEHDQCTQGESQVGLGTNRSIPNGGGGGAGNSSTSYGSTGGGGGSYVEHGQDAHAICWQSQHG